MTTALEQIPVLTIDARLTNLGQWAGKVRLVVNVASKCGLTPQYGLLESMYRANKARGFEVLAFPADDFAQQEPGTNAEIRAFCSLRFGVSFPLFAKIAVKGHGKHPLYQTLTAVWPHSRGIPGVTGTDFRSKLVRHGIDVGPPGEVVWNFEKFLVDRTGHVVDRFAPDVAPDAPIVVDAIQRALG